MDYLDTPLRLRAPAAPLCAALGVRTPLRCEHLQLMNCTISQTFRNCVLRGTHTRARCMCALGTVAEGVLVEMGARRSAGEGAMEFQVHGPGPTVFNLNLVPTSSKTTWNYLIFTHTAPRRAAPTRHPPGIPNPAQRAPAPALTPGGDSTPFS